MDLSILNKVLLLGDERLYQKSDAVKPEELQEVKERISVLHDIIVAFREKYGAGRAIAAPQIGYMKRLIYMFIDKPIVFINPVLHDFSEETFDLWDDCMSFPGLLVKVRRYKSVKITFRDLNWEEHTIKLNDDLSELIQHEYDHLDGILATMRAIDQKSLKIKP